MIKYSDQISIWLKDLGYTHYFYVGGGNIMHLTESLDKHLIGIPVIHEVAAGIGAEYFNEINERGSKALALVTAGPGLTNLVTAIAGAWLESRELLIIGGQVKTSDYSSEKLRSRGIQEIKGTDLVNSITKKSYKMSKVINSNSFYNLVSRSWIDRKGPVFIEIPIDIQARQVRRQDISSEKSTVRIKRISEKNLLRVQAKYNRSLKPILLMGGGISYETSQNLRALLQNNKIPIMTTYNGVDRYDPKNENYLGRPNTWGQRSSNIIIQKSDLIIAVGTRLGLQQTGFNWREFGRNAEIIHIDIDREELFKGHPLTRIKIEADANHFLAKFLKLKLTEKQDWLNEANQIRNKIPRIEKINKTRKGFISPYEFIVKLESLTKKNDVIIPCSSGSAFTLSMQLLEHKNTQRILTNKSLASMGYGLSGAIGASISRKEGKTILIEGDGGFAQNIQEVGTAKQNNLNLKIFIFHDQGHASIRMTQQNYFNGKYLGCDNESGLGLPDWNKAFSGWGLEPFEINQGFESDPLFKKKFNSKGLSVFIVKIDPKQTYFPKITSFVKKNGDMESNPIDRMTPEIDY